MFHFEEQVARINRDLAQIEPVKSLLYKKNSLDLMFILDISSSMGPWIDASKAEINSIIEYVKSQNYGIKIRVSIVCYSDY